MLQLDQIKAFLKDANLRAVAQSIGVHENTLYRLMAGKEPTYSTVKRLSDYIEGKFNV